MADSGWTATTLGPISSGGQEQRRQREVLAKNRRELAMVTEVERWGQGLSDRCEGASVGRGRCDTTVQEKSAYAAWSTENGETEDESSGAGRRGLLLRSAASKPTDNSNALMKLRGSSRVGSGSEGEQGLTVTTAAASVFHHDRAAAAIRHRLWAGSRTATAEGKWQR